MSSHQLSYPQKRRSTRIELSVPLMIKGVGALSEPYHEELSTLSVSCHGCSYKSKHDVIQGEFVDLDINPSQDGPPACSARARVKWVRRLEGRDRAVLIGVELESAGNVWGIASPPKDWFPPQPAKVIDLGVSGRELKVVAAREQQPAPRRVQPDKERKEVAPPVSSLGQAAAGLGEHIQIMASEAARAALATEKSRSLDEFRIELREEATKAVQSIIAASTVTFTRDKLKELSEALETAARTNHERWMKKLDQELSQRADRMAATTIERVQRSMETTRAEAVDRFVARLRDQFAPLLAEAKEALRTLEARETEFKNRSQAINEEFERQIATNSSAATAKTRAEMGGASVAAMAKTKETLDRLSQDFEKMTRENMQSILQSIDGTLTKALQERAARITQEFSTGLQSYARAYLESVGKSIAEIPASLSRR